MAEEVREVTYWAIDANGDGIVDGDGLNAIVTANFPLEPGDPANFFTRATTFAYNVGGDGGVFDDVAEDRFYYASDSEQLSEGDELPGFGDFDPPPEGGEPPSEEADLPVLSIAPDEAVLDEGDKGKTEYSFTVTRSGDDLSEKSSVDVTLVPGDTDADDFGGELPETQTVDFKGDDTEETVKFKVSGDTDAEGDESFEVRLEFAEGAVIDEGASTAAATIINDDETPEPDLPDPEDFNQIDGTEGNDYLQGTKENDLIQGFADTDVLEGKDGDDILDGGAGTDVLYGDDDDDILFGGAGTDVLFGGSGDDVLIGGDDGDVISGAIGDDIIFGGEGEDFIRGEEGDDILTGGMRSDLFYFSGVFGDDIITDFDETQDNLLFELADTSEITEEVVENGTLLTVESDEATGTVLLLGVSDLDESALA